MTLDLSSFAVKSPPKRVWNPPQQDEFARGSVLAVDQSLAALGWAWVLHHNGGMTVRARGSIRTAPADYPTSHEGSLQRAMKILERFRDEMGKLQGDEDFKVHGYQTVFVHEQPPIGSKMVRPESSLLSALSVRVAMQQGFDRTMQMVSNQRSKRILTGNSNSTKAQWHEAIPRHITGGARPKNEGERDAVCLALTYLYDARKDH